MATLKFTYFLIKGTIFIRISNLEAPCTHEANDNHFNYFKSCNAMLLCYWYVFVAI